MRGAMQSITRAAYEDSAILDLVKADIEDRLGAPAERYEEHHWKMVEVMTDDGPMMVPFGVTDDTWTGLTLVGYTG